MGSLPPASDSPQSPPEELRPSRAEAGIAAGWWRIRRQAADEAGTSADRLPEQIPDVAGVARPVRSWAYAPATYVLVGVNMAVFLSMVFNGVAWTNPTGEQLLRWGANNPTLVVLYGEWWRVVTAMFVHAGMIHLLSNMWCLWNLGLLGEPLLGPAGVLVAYVLTGAAGNLLSIGVNLAFRTDSVGAGASGAVFGLAGVLIVLLKSPQLEKRLPAKELRSLRLVVILFAGISLTLGFAQNAFTTGVTIDNMAHLGGFLGGLLFALPLLPLPAVPREVFLLRRRVATGLLSGVLVLFGYYLSTAFPASTWPLR